MTGAEHITETRPLNADQQRATDLLRATYVAPVNGAAPILAALAAALDAAEARGRAEVATKVLDLADVVVQDQHLSGHRLARRLRAMVTEESEHDHTCGKSKPPWAYGRVFPCTVTDELALPGGDAERTPPAQSPATNVAAVPEHEHTWVSTYADGFTSSHELCAVCRKRRTVTK